jgi:hypothetical protein
MSEFKAPQSLTPDQAAAHEFLSELRTRISMQPLPYQYGVETTALESLYALFGLGRTAMKNHPGCAEFAHRTTHMLNVDLRPVTAKWHRALNEGRLKSRDGANEFRADLETVQASLRAFAADLHEMAYGFRHEDDQTPLPMNEAALVACVADLPFGIPRNTLIPDAVAKINAAERAAVNARRDKYGLPQDGNNAVGLGFSGGGIRSATFCLGVNQVLAERGLLKHVDFMSTVSGGGYLGSFLTRRLDSDQAHAGVGAPHGPDPEPIRYLRQHAKYLSAASLKERWSMVTATFAGLLLNWTAPLFLVALAALVAVGISKGLQAMQVAELPWDAVLFVAGAVTLIALLIYATGMQFAQRTGGRALGWITAGALALVFLWLMVKIYVALTSPQSDWPIYWAVIGVATASLAAIPMIVRFIPIFQTPEARQIVLKTTLILAGLIIPIGAIALSFWLYHRGMQPIDIRVPTWRSPVVVDGWLVLAGLTAVFGFVALFLLNINLTAPHRLYRYQLARTFVHRQEGEVEPVTLATLNKDGFAPYHLINATVNLPSSTNVALRERLSDFFLFSKHYCGAPSIGYTATAQWHAGRRPIDLATAIAVSGAAASSHMGLGSIPSLSAMLTFLNVRLGYWIRQPGTRGFQSPGFSCLIREMFGIFMSEKQDWINLSDGGHIENMGIYELLRRRCKFIISVDGEADPESTFHGHLTLIRHAQIDFGIRIEPDLTDLRPDLTTRFSQSHTIMCRVLYPAIGDQPAGVGLLLYLKLSVTGNELETIRRYRLLQPDFPHQTTLDQFFDEEQFEAYRQLGVHVAEGLFAPALLHGAEPATVRKWFEALAQNLLLPAGDSGSRPDVLANPVNATHNRI